jgi:hypothetical protein
MKNLYFENIRRNKLNINILHANICFYIYKKMIEVGYMNNHTIFKRHLKMNG